MTEAGRLYFAELTTLSKSVDNYIILHLSPLHVHDCAYNVLREFCGSTGDSYTTGKLNSYNPGLETGPEWLYALGAADKLRVGYGCSNQILNEVTGQGVIGN